MDIFRTLNRFRIISFLKKWNLFNFIFGALDIFAIAVAFQAAYLLIPDRSTVFFFNARGFFLIFLGIAPMWIFILYLLKMTEIPRTKSYKLLLIEYAISAMAVLLILILFYFLFKTAQASRRYILEVVAFGFAFLLGIRLIEYELFRAYRSRGYNFINAILLADEKSIPFIETLLHNAEWGYRIAAIFTSSEEVTAKYQEDIIVLPDNYLKVVNDLMEVDLIDEVLYIKSKENASEIRTVIRSCEELGVIFRLMYKDEKKANLSSAIKTQIGNTRFMTFINIPHNPYALAIKKVIDVFGSLILILFFLPFMLISAIIIKVTSKGPVIYTQKRVGLRGRNFDLYKFRTMIINADDLKKDLMDRNEAESPAFKIKDDPRITKFGKFLRASGLDELPQLFNILKGEMSLIGPRPPLPEETAQYKRWQLRRLSVKPGLSCFWQVKPDRNSIRTQKWMELDLVYIDNWSLRLDFMILIKTIRSVFMRSGM